MKVLTFAEVLLKWSVGHGKYGPERCFIEMYHYHLKWRLCHLLTFKLFQTCMIFLLLLNFKEDILKNVCNQTVAGSH